MEDCELVTNLSLTGKYRATLYLSPPKIDSVYIQKVSQVTELSRSGRIKGGLSGSILGFLGAEASGEKGLESKVAFNPMLQAIVAENAAQEMTRLIDISSTPPQPGELLRYIGPAHVTLMNRELDGTEVGLSTEICQLIENKRKIQEEIWRFRSDGVRSVVVTFVANGKAYATIATTDFIDNNMLSSYYAEPNFGVLCMVEDIHPQVTFLNPLWIWSEAS